MNGELSTELITEVAESKPLRDETGRFLPGNKAAAGPGLSPNKRIALMVRNKIEEADATGGKSAVEKVIDNAIVIATDPAPKTRKEAIWAMRALFEYAYGTPMKSEEELDAMRNSGVQIAIISVPGAQPMIACTDGNGKALTAPDYDDE